MKGIDVSYANGVVNWEAVAAAGYKFAIVRCTYGRHGVDDKFIANVHHRLLSIFKKRAY